MCSKESSRFSHHWKTHYLTHVSDEEKPFKCEICNKAFIEKRKLKSHTERYHPATKQENMNIKMEYQ